MKMKQPEPMIRDDVYLRSQSGPSVRNGDKFQGTGTVKTPYIYIYIFVCFYRMLRLTSKVFFFLSFLWR